MAEHLQAGVVVVGGGPGGAATAAHLAAHGVDVLLLEKASYPRDKVCGDGLTPQAVREIDLLGIPHSGAPGDDGGWQPIRGLRLRAGRRSVEVPWPETESWPHHGLTRARTSLDQVIAEHARAAGARVLEHHTVRTVTRNGAGRIDGVEAAVLDERGRRTGERITVGADVVIAADGVSSRTAVSAGIPRREDRPMGVGVRAYHTTGGRPLGRRAEWMESWLQLPDAHGDPLPGYGWLFPLADGTVNVGLGILDTSPQFGTLDYRALLRQWTGALEEDWGITEQTRLGRISGAALPMAFNRTPQHVPGMLLIGDAAGMVSPFNGEGIGFAMEAGRHAAAIVVDALATGSDAGADAVLARYPVLTQRLWGGHFSLGAVFARLIGHPQVMRAALATGLSVPPLLRTVVRIMGNVTERTGGDVIDRAVRLLESAVPAATTADAGPDAGDAGPGEPGASARLDR